MLAPLYPPPHTQGRRLMGERLLEQLLVSVPNAELPPAFRTKGGGGSGSGGAAGGGGGVRAKPAGKPSPAAAAPSGPVRGPAEV